MTLENPSGITEQNYQLKTIAFFIIDYLEKNRCFKQHLIHCKHVDATIIKLVKWSGADFDEFDKFKLYIAAYLHDIGQLIEESTSKAPTSKNSLMLFEKHINKLFSKLHINENFTINGISFKVILCEHIKNLCINHCDYIDSDDGYPKFINSINSINSEQNEKVCYLRLAELLAQLNTKDKCNKKCYSKDYPSWVFSTLQRCWPDRLGNNDLKCCYETVYYDTDFYKTYNNNNTLNISIIRVNSVSNHEDKDMLDFLYGSYIFQLKKEKKVMEELLSKKHKKSYKINLEYHVFPKEKETTQMCEAFSNNDSLRIIYSYCFIPLIGVTDVNPENETISDILSNVSGNYLTDIFIEGYNKCKLENYKYTGLKIDDGFESECSKSEHSFKIKINKLDYSFNYLYNGHEIAELKIKNDGKIGKDRLKRAILSSLDIWCNGFYNEFEINDINIDENNEKSRNEIG